MAVLPWYKNQTKTSKENYRQTSPVNLDVKTLPQNTSKVNARANENHYILWQSEIYSRNTGVVQHMKSINVIHLIHRINKIKSTLSSQLKQ